MGSGVFSAVWPLAKYGSAKLVTQKLPSTSTLRLIEGPPPIDGSPPPGMAYAPQIWVRPSTIGNWFRVICVGREKSSANRNTGKDGLGTVSDIAKNVRHHSIRTAVPIFSTSPLMSWFRVPSTRLSYWRSGNGRFHAKSWPLLLHWVCTWLDLWSWVSIFHTLWNLRNTA